MVLVITIGTDRGNTTNNQGAVSELTVISVPFTPDSLRTGKLACSGPFQPRTPECRSQQPDPVFEGQAYLFSKTAFGQA